MTAATKHTQPLVVPGARSKHSNCFGCAPRNTNGLALSMNLLDEDGLVSLFRLPERFESYPGVIHGGIVSTVLDEVMGNVIAVLDSKLCFTVTLRVKYLAPLHTNELYRCVARLTRRPDSDDRDLQGGRRDPSGGPRRSAGDGFRRPINGSR